jgi:hypothetical protein
MFVLLPQNIFIMIRQLTDSIHFQEHIDPSADGRDALDKLFIS